MSSREQDWRTRKLSHLLADQLNEKTLYRRCVAQPNLAKLIASLKNTSLETFRSIVKAQMRRP